MRTCVANLSRGILGDDLSVLGVEEGSLLETELTQVTREEPVLVLGALRLHLDAVATDTIEGMADNEVVATGDLVFEATGDPELDQNSLWKLVLNLDHLLHEVVAFWVDLGIDLEDRLFDPLRVEYDRSVAARDDILLLSDTFDQ